MNQKTHVAFNISTVFLKLKDFSRSQAVTYIVNVLTLIFPKQCKIES